MFCLPHAGAARLQPLVERSMLPSALLIPFRTKKSAKKQKKMKKDPKMVEMKEYAKRMEIQKMMLSATLKAVKKGEPLDAEMLNPARKRSPPTLPKEEKDRRYLLAKEWSRFQMRRHTQELQLLRGLTQSREKALTELKKVSSSLHFQALELNSDLFPFQCRGPTVTPPILSYAPPDPDN